MGGEVPKQFLPLGSKPVIVHTVERFIAALPENAPVVVVVAKDELGRWREIAELYGLWQRVVTCTGGQTRAESVKNGLQAIDCRTVAIHDAVRPLAGAGLIERAFAEAEAHRSAIPYVTPVDSFRTEDGAVDRDSLMAVQTPQVFRCENLKKAYENLRHLRFTDDAGVWEAAGHRVHMCEGERQNIKITTQADLVVAQALINAGY